MRAAPPVDAFAPFASEEDARARLTPFVERGNQGDDDAALPPPADVAALRVAAEELARAQQAMALRVDDSMLQCVLIMEERMAAVRRNSGNG